MEEQYDYFVKVYGYVITIEDIPKEQALAIVEIFQKFRRDSLVNLKLVLPFDDIVLNKIICFDPESFNA